MPAFSRRAARADRPTEVQATTGKSKISVGRFPCTSLQGKREAEIFDSVLSFRAAEFPFISYQKLKAEFRSWLFTVAA
jgi:hypothetical protein